MTTTSRQKIIAANDTAAIDPLVAHVVAAILRHAEAGELPLFVWTLGLPQNRLRAIVSRCIPEFSKLAPFSEPHYEVLRQRVPPAFPQLFRLMQSHVLASADAEHGEWLSHAVAAACFGTRPLWIDLDLADPEQLKALLKCYYRPDFVCRSDEEGWKSNLLHRATNNLNAVCP